ncbi:unnamed protein product [Owenia fusiformis]|uniref:U1 small nuclear ribonucleoprotein 70 kDa n=1 Tax=Owenia fusiformis TaxID=6347 RepID=A0A8J1Y4N8_OWEFU|nr:unnamed protein product [Owenia fusiformis]
MTAFLPPNLLALFAPRDPIPYLPPADKLPIEKRKREYAGVSAFLKDFEDPKDTPPPTRVETKDERKERKRKERAEQVAYKLEQDLALWDPNNIPGGTEDAFKTLFIARINYDTSESKLRREFEVYGPVKKVALLKDTKTGKPRGYAFVEYEHERDMHSAYKHADGKKIDGRRVLVDVERSRTVKGWRPRRLGGGLGGTRKGGADVNTRFSGRDDNARERSRSGSPGGRRRRSRSRSRDRRRRRSRSRERRRRSRSRDRIQIKTEPGLEDSDVKVEGEKRRRRSRSRDRKRSRRSRSRDRKRSRSKDRKRSRRSRSRDRKRSRSRDRKSRKSEREKAEKSIPNEGGDGPIDFDNVVIKSEPNMDVHYGGDPVEQPNGVPQENEHAEELNNEEGAEPAGDAEQNQSYNEYGTEEPINEYGSVEDM